MEMSLKGFLKTEQLLIFRQFLLTLQDLNLTV